MTEYLVFLKRNSGYKRLKNLEASDPSSARSEVASRRGGTGKNDFMVVPKSNAHFFKSVG